MEGWEGRGRGSVCESWHGMGVQGGPELNRERPAALGKPGGPGHPTEEERAQHTGLQAKPRHTTHLRADPKLQAKSGRKQRSCAPMTSGPGPTGARVCAHQQSVRRNNIQQTSREPDVRWTSCDRHGHTHLTTPHDRGVKGSSTQQSPETARLWRESPSEGTSKAQSRQRQHFHGLR